MKYTFKQVLVVQASSLPLSPPPPILSLSLSLPVVVATAVFVGQRGSDRACFTETWLNVCFYLFFFFLKCVYMNWHPVHVRLCRLSRVHSLLFIFFCLYACACFIFFLFFSCLHALIKLFNSYFICFEYVWIFLLLLLYFLFFVYVYYQ